MRGDGKLKGKAKREPGLHTPAKETGGSSTPLPQLQSIAPPRLHLVANPLAMPTMSTLSLQTETRETPHHPVVSGRRMRVCMLSYSIYDSDNRVRRYAETLARD